MRVSLLFSLCFCTLTLVSSRIDIPRSVCRHQEAIDRPRRGGAFLKRKDAPPGGTASVSSEIFNLIKTIVGAGVLGLPSGIAAFGNSPSAVIPAVLLMAVIGSLSAFGFATIGIVCGKTGALSFRDAWSKTVGERSAWMPALACTLVTACSVLTYSMILSDTIPALLHTVLPHLALSRSQALLGVTGTLLLPLCLKKDLRSLAPFSLVGVFGMLYTAVVMVSRCLGHSYTSVLDTGVEANALLTSLGPALRPAFGQRGWKAALSPNAAILVSMLSTAYMAHYNAPKFYWELKDKPQFPKVVSASFASALVLMATVAIAGFATFGSSSQGLILNNYSVKDTWMQVSRGAVTVSLLCSYPLAFVGVRDGILDLFKVPQETRERTFVPMTVALLAAVTSLALVAKDIGFIMALGGATWGNCVIYLFPALMLVHLSKSKPELKPQVPLATATGLIGVVLATIGTKQALKSIL